MKTRFKDFFKERFLPLSDMLIQQSAAKMLNAPYLSIILIGCFLYFPAYFFVSWDLSTYLAYGQNILAGNGFTDPAGYNISARFGYVFQIAALQYFFGAALWPYPLLEMFWSVLFFLGLFQLGRHLFGLKIALTSVFLLLLSSSWIFWMPRHIDPIWPALLFFSMAFLTSPNLEKKRYFVVFAAFLAGMAFWVKELAAFYAFLPLLAYIARLIPLKLWDLIVFYVIYGLMIYISLIATSYYSGHGQDLRIPQAGYMDMIWNVMGEKSFYGFLNLISYGFIGVLKYIYSPFGTHSLLPNLPLLPIGIVILILSLKSIWVLPKLKPVQLLILAMICFVPYISLAGQLSLRPSQILLVVGLFTLVTVALLFHQCEKRPHLLKPFLICLFLLQIFAADKTKNAMRQSFAGSFKFKHDLILQEMRGTELTKWVSENIPPGQNIIIEHVPYQHGVYALLEARHQISLLPFEQTTPSKHWPYYHVTQEGHLYDFVTLPKNLITTKTPPIFFLSTEILKQHLRDNNIQYIALSSNGLGSAVIPLLEQSSGIEKQAIINAYRRETVTIYRVTDIDQISLGTAHQDSHIEQMMTHLKETQDPDYDWYKQAIAQKLKP